MAQIRVEGATYASSPPVDLKQTAEAFATFKVPVALSQTIIFGREGDLVAEALMTAMGGRQAGWRAV